MKFDFSVTGTVFAAALAAVLFSSCKPRESVAVTDDSGNHEIIELHNASSSVEALSEPTQTWHPSDKRLCILFGYGYNSPEFVKSSIESLEKKYGSASDGGLIYPLVYPDDFKRGGVKSFVTELPNLLKEYQCIGVILLGAPENTNYAVARLQDQYDAQPIFPVFSFFPQDDVLGMEAVSDFVIDKEQDVQSDGSVKNESEQVFVKDVPEMLERSVEYMVVAQAPLAKDANLFAEVKKITGGQKTSHFVDPETGLQSVNHFILN